MPWFLPSTSSCAKHAHHLACTAELVIQYFCATVVGVLMMNSSASLSKVAVVSISTALLPEEDVRGNRLRVLVKPNKNAQEELKPLCCWGASNQ